MVHKPRYQPWEQDRTSSRVWIFYVQILVWHQTSVLTDSGQNWKNIANSKNLKKVKIWKSLKIWKKFANVDKKNSKLRMWKNGRLRKFSNFQVQDFNFFKFSNSIFWVFWIIEFNFQFVQVFNFKTKIWILSRPSPKSNLVMIWSR